MLTTKILKLFGIQKFQQLAKDAQSNGDPVLFENYLQHADHYTRKLKELNLKFKDERPKDSETDKKNSEQILKEESQNKNIETESK